MSTTLDIDKLGVFQVFTGGGTRSGVLIDDRLLVTNCHVVEPYQKVAVEKRDKQRILGTVRRIHPKRDLAIVELSEPLEASSCRFPRTARSARSRPCTSSAFRWACRSPSPRAWSPTRSSSSRVRSSSRPTPPSTPAT